MATKRVKHAIKSDIPSVADGVSKLVHIGKATVDKLLDLRTAAKEEGFEIGVPDNLNRIEKVGQFRELVELSEMNSDIKNKVGLSFFKRQTDGQLFVVHLPPSLPASP